jgi:hypothetical protein
MPGSRRFGVLFESVVPSRCEDRQVSDLRWNRLEAARANLIAAFAADGVDRVEYVASPPDAWVWVWLGTGTDLQPDALSVVVDLHAQVGRLLADASVEGIEVAGVRVQSAETVNRDYGGSWFNAVR